ncbi:polysaccharide deacetylase [Streptomyces sp. NPDC048297]|uniref:polysaccharide deacetylase family protein n=1 Tax=Streptomyces sp. NPDC048297 TaxID=3365531 RepID=UPI00372113DE
MTTPTGDATQPAAPITWPTGFRAAANLGFDLDAEDVALTIDRGTRDRLSVMSHQAYGALTGVPRVLDLLDRFDLKATFFAPGYTVERYPDLLRRIRDAGHEIAHHGYLHEAMAGLSYKEEAAVIDRGLESLDKVLGVRPVGYRAPLWETSYSTAEILLDRGFLYDSSLMDSDLPYELAERPGDGARSIVEIPVSWALDDWEQFAFVPEVFGPGVIEDPAKALSMWTGELAEAYRYESCFTLTIHPFLSGRLGRLRALESLLETMAGLPELWVTTCGEIAEHVRSLELTPRVFPQPEVD